MLLTVSGGILSCLVMNSLIDFSGSSVVCSGMPLRTSCLCTCKSRMVSFMALLSAVTELIWVVSVLTECYELSDLFALVRVSIYP